MISVKKHDLDTVDFREDLQKVSQTSTFFQTCDWLKVWNKHFKKEAFVVAVYKDSEIIGAGFFSLENNKIEFLGTSQVVGSELVTDYGDIFSIVGQEKIVWEQIVDFLRREYKGFELVLDFVRETSPSFAILKGLSFAEVKTDSAPYIRLPSSWDEYLVNLGRKHRHELRRKIRRLEAEQIEYISKAPNDLFHIETFLKLMGESDVTKKKFLSPAMRVFFADLLQTLDPKLVILSFLKKGKEFIAATITFEYNRRVYLYNSGYNLNYGHLAPGLILKAYLIKNSIEKGFEVYDFLRGTERYKYDLGGVDCALYTMNTKL